MATAVFSVGAFASVHAWIIIPIWTQALRGLPLALAGSLGMAWAFQHFVARRTPSIGNGLEFGALMFLTQLPAAALDTSLRLTALRRADSLETAAAVVLAFGTGAVAGWLATGRRNEVLPFAAAAVGLLFATAGPLPFAQSPRGLWLGIAIGPICLAAGMVLAATRRLFISEVA